MRVLLALLLAGSLHAATVHSATCSNSDLNTAIGLASNGDTVDVTSTGSVAWTGNVTIGNTKGITLNIAGCVNTGNSGQIVATLGTNGSTRITGCHTTGAYAGPPYFITVTGSPSTKYFRIDHCTFTDTTTGDTFILLTGQATGLIDTNTFNTSGQAGELIHNEAYGNGIQTGWGLDFTPGSPNQVYIETNTFNNSNAGATSDKIIESYYGALTVLRDNALNGDLGMDMHGTAGQVGVRWWEAYNNIWAPAGGRLTAYATFRAGSGVFWGNHQTGSFGSGAPGVGLEEEDTGYPDCFQIGRGYDPSIGCTSSANNTEWLSPAYLWGNDSAIQTSIQSVSTNIVAGRDFFCWNGSAWSTTCSNTATNITPITVCETAASSGTTSSCPSTITYTPFTYPYPLDANGMPNPVGSSSPTVTTTAASSITTTTASAGGNVTSDGGASVTSRGTCYSTSANPTTPCTSDGTGTGTFASSLSGLSTGTLYHIRAFATNSVGTSYGSDLTFTTSSPSTAGAVCSGPCGVFR